MRYFIDANVFLRYLVPDSRKDFVFKECQELINAWRSQKFEAVTNTHVLAEVMYVMRSFYEVEKNEATESLQSLLATDIKIDDRLSLLLALDIYEHHSVKFVDALIASHPDINSRLLPLISYDRDFDKLDVKRLEPRQVLTMLG